MNTMNRIPTTQYDHWRTMSADDYHEEQERREAEQNAREERRIDAMEDRLCEDWEGDL